MTKKIDWNNILFHCKEKVQKRINPLLKKANHYQSNLGIGAGGDPINQIDFEAEKAIVQTLLQNHISFTLISEESGIKEYGKTPRLCYITVDPIDGTTNLTRGIPFYATSIAVSSKPIISDVHTALVADLTHNIIYTAEKKKGAFCNNQQIKASKIQSLNEAIIGIDLNIYKNSKSIPRLKKLISQTKHIRHLGANALELCYVADGTIDAFIDIRGKLRTTDAAAAWLIMKEAKVKISALKSTGMNIKLDPQEKVKLIVAANQKLHKTILNLINN
jgi:myo-inositol-1(or 4)-monophosphatase